MTDVEKKKARLLIKGRVQGVGFRWFVYTRARELGLKGSVRNLADGNVETIAEGEQIKIAALIDEIRKGTSFSRVVDLMVEWRNFSGEYNSFDIVY
jgi:acylphosphatase